jgi:hypothetical protein
MSCLSAIEPLCGPSSDSPALAIVQANALLIEEEEEVVQTVLVSAYASARLRFGRCLVELGHGQRRGLEHVQQRFG